MKINAVVMFDKNFLLSFLFNFLKTNWCKCALSGDIGDLFFNTLRIIEKSISIAGYHRSKTIKYGDIISFEIWSLINK